MIQEPVSRQPHDAFERPRLLEEVSGTGDDLELGFAANLLLPLPWAKMTSPFGDRAWQPKALEAERGLFDL